MPKNTVCLIDECKSRATCRNYCSIHYDRERRAGRLVIRQKRAAYGEPEAFIEYAVEYTGTDCLIWPYAKTKGYGVMSGTRYAHAEVLGRVQGQRPSPDHQACHEPQVCHEPACVNPAHLRWDTAQANSMDRHLDGTVPSGPLSDEAVRVIRESPHRGVDLAAQFDTTPSTISSIRLMKTYKWVN